MLCQSVSRYDDYRNDKLGIFVLNGSNSHLRLVTTDSSPRGALRATDAIGKHAIDAEKITNLARE